MSKTDKIEVKTCHHCGHEWEPQGQEPEEVPAVPKSNLEESEPEANEAQGRPDLHRSIRGSSLHAPYTRHEYGGKNPERCVWCGRAGESCVTAAARGGRTAAETS